NKQLAIREHRHRRRQRKLGECRRATVAAGTAHTGPSKPHGSPIEKTSYDRIVCLIDLNYAVVWEQLFRAERPVWHDQRHRFRIWRYSMQAGHVRYVDGAV